MRPFVPSLAFGPAAPVLAPISADDSFGASSSSPRTESEPGDERYVVLGPVPSRRKAEEWLFVLRAVNVSAMMRNVSAFEWEIVVPEQLADRARHELRAYEAEALERHAERPLPDRPLYASSPWALLAVGLMAGFYLVTGPVASRSFWFTRGIADAGQILHGAFYQLVTALTLHADTQHLLGNTLVGALFLTLVHRRFGPGLGTLLVIISGAAGNLLNALWHHGAHRSLGASTAVMAAIAIVAATQLVLNRERGRRDRHRWLRTWGPIVAGLALLGTFGASPHSDLHAHGFGFLTGAVLGLIVAFVLRKRSKPLPGWLQVVFGLMSAGLVVGAWTLALVRF